MINNERTFTIIEKIRSSLQAQKYGDFVALFAADGVYELPFALSGSVARYEGISKIRERFDEIGNSPVHRLYELDRVNVEAYETLDPNVAVIELSIEGRLRSNNKPIKIQSSLAILLFEGDKIKRYRDYPNAAGIAEAVGLLAQDATSLAK